MPFSKKAVGQSIDRIDGREKVLGRALFAADHRIPDLAYAVVVQSEIPHGSVNTSGLEAVIKGASHAPGVLYILSSEKCTHAILHRCILLILYGTAANYFEKSQGSQLEKCGPDPRP